MAVSHKLYKIKVIGKVQGVFFRKNTALKAKELNLSGTVKNEGDGSVFIIAQGEEKQLHTFIEWCKQGPPKAEVENVSFTEADTKMMNDFRIIY